MKTCRTFNLQRRRTGILSTAATGLLVVALVALACSFAMAEPAEERRPNMVLIISDDQSYTDFGFMGSRHAETPHLDRLAAQSARYVNGYVPSSVCRPSLASILTGLYPFQHKIHFNHSPPGNSAFNRMNSKSQYVQGRSRSFELIRSVDTLPRLLRDELGYRSFQSGKFWEGHHVNAGFTEGMTVFDSAESDTHGKRVLASGEIVAHGNGDRGLAIGRETMQPIFDFVEQCGQEPFLIWYAPFLPHRPHDPPESFLKRFRDRPEVPQHEVPYLASVCYFDHTVGQLITFFEEQQLAEDTIFVFVVDNGWRPSSRRAASHPSDYEHTDRSKRAPFDEGLRTPILIRWDHHIPPATHEKLVSSIDIMPTLLAATGLQDKTAELPGLNLLEHAMGNEPLGQGRAVFGDIYPGDATSLENPAQDIAYRWVRQGRLKLIVPHNHREKPPWGGYLEREALYDVVANPTEQENLIDDTSYAEQIAALRQLLDAWWTPNIDGAKQEPINR